MPEAALFVGIGSDHGDDRVGWLVADVVSRLPLLGVAVRSARSPIDLLNWLDGIRWLGVCDACRGEGPIGHWRRWVWPDLDASFGRPSGTHLYGLSDTLRLAAQLGVLPQRVILWGIEIAAATPDSDLTLEVNAAISLVADDIARTMDPDNVV
jgi:hydrogenase maturation protease